MKIKSVQFVKSVAKLSQLPKEPFPEVAFAGRSNVGKSSLLNALFNRKKMALVSSTPGKTRLLNFFLVNEKYHFVDLPGYGFAKVSRGMQIKWQRLIDGYLTRSAQLRGVIVLTDIRHDVQDTDLQLVEWLAVNGIPQIIVGTKADKLSKNKLNTQLRKNAKALEPFGVQNILPFSAVTNAGKPELLQAIGEVLHLPAPQMGMGEGRKEKREARKTNLRS